MHRIELNVATGEQTTVQYTAAEEAEWQAAQQANAIRPPPVPQSVTPLQGLLALDAAGLADDYELWANAPERTFAERAFINRAQVWRRDDPLLQAGTGALGMTDAQLDQLFILAAAL